MVLVFLVILAFLVFSILAELERGKEAVSPTTGNCPDCAQEVDPDWLLCPRCRALLQESCTGCGKHHPTYHGFCTWCGVKREGLSA